MLVVASLCFLYFEEATHMPWPVVPLFMPRASSVSNPSHVLQCPFPAILKDTCNYARFVKTVFLSLEQLIRNLHPSTCGDSSVGKVLLHRYGDMNSNSSTHVESCSWLCACLQPHGG